MAFTRCVPHVHLLATGVTFQTANLSHHKSAVMYHEFKVYKKVILESKDISENLPIVLALVESYRTKQLLQPSQKKQEVNKTKRKERQKQMYDQNSDKLTYRLTTSIHESLRLSKHQWSISDTP